jgi:hypothetical protein
VRVRVGAGAISWRHLNADRRNLVLIVLLGVLLGSMYFIAIDLQAPQYTFTQQQNAFSGNAGSPYRYRVLVPALLELGTRIFAFMGSPQRAFQAASLVYECLGLSVQLVALYALLRQFFSASRSLVGATFTAGMTVLTLAYFTYQPWSILEVAFFALGFLLAYRGRWLWLAGIVVLASLNRETGVFLPVAVFLASLGELHSIGPDVVRRLASSRDVRIAFGLVVLSTLIFAGLRLVRGSADPVDPLPDVIRRNLERNNLIAALMGIPLLLGVGWIYAALGWRSAPCFLRGLARVVPLYLIAFAIWGWWREVRILTSLYPVLVPLVLVYCGGVGEQLRCEPGAGARELTSRPDSRRNGAHQ